MASPLKVPRLDFTSPDIATKWREFKIVWVNLEHRVNLKEKKSNEERVKILLDLMKPQGEDLYNEFKWEDEKDKLKVTKVIAKFEKYCTTVAAAAKNRERLTSQGEGDQEDMENFSGSNGHDEMVDIKLDVTKYSNAALENLIAELNSDFSILGVSISGRDDFDALNKIPPNEVEISRYKPTLIPEKISVLCWNIDGIDKMCQIGSRMHAVTRFIETEEFDIVLLQEVTGLTFNYIAKKLSQDYMIIRQENSFWYFTVTMLKKMTMGYSSHKIIPFRNTDQGRSILLTKATVGSTKVDIMNVHLETGGMSKTISSYRRTQMKKCLDIASATPSDSNVIFGGDMNIREREIQSINIPKKVCDLWVQQGSNPANEFTWDMTINRNLETDWKKNPKLRFDRVYFRPSNPEALQPKYFGLCGKQKCPGRMLDDPEAVYPSDHWGIVAKFTLLAPARIPIQDSSEAQKAKGLSKTWKEEDEDTEERNQEFVKENWDDDD